MKSVLTLLLFMSCVATVSAQGRLSEGGSGHYWTKSGEKVAGEFKISYKTNLIGGSIIKHYINGGKEGRVDLDSLQSLVINTDSFIVGHNFTVDGWATYSQDLLEVFQVGEINLYMHIRKVKHSTGPNTIPIGTLNHSFVISSDNGKSFYGIATKKQFEYYFLPLIAKNESLTKRILLMKKREWLDALTSLVKEFNRS